MRYISFLVIFAILLFLFPLGLGTVYSESDSWDGTVAKNFAGGSGTEADPYLIETAEQLAYLSHACKEKLLSRHNIFKLTADIQLNDEIFTFHPDTGLIHVTDGINTAYLGTGIKGDNSGSNTVFDTAPSQMGKWYVSESSTESGVYEGVLLTWSPVGTEDAPFQNDFDANGHAISGIYINDTTMQAQGLFGVIKSATIRNTNITNSCIIAYAQIGGITGHGDGSIVDCMHSGIVCGWDKAGGIAGAAEVTVNQCINRGFVMGHTTIGGIAGDATKELLNCTNYSHVTATAYVGGIVGNATNTIRDSINHGNILGDTQIGGIVGSGQSVLNCRNLGTVQGKTQIGGIIGKNASDSSSSISSISYCYNHADVYGQTAVGGILGETTKGAGHNSTTSQGKLSHCYNKGTVRGQKFVGGIAGNSDRYEIPASYCSNMGDVYGSDYVAGIVGGMCCATVCYNTGSIICSDDGKENVGGIIGYGKALQCSNAGSISILGTSRQIGGIVGYGTALNCYNTGSIIGEKAALIGGIAGALCTSYGATQNCYNVGTVKGSTYVGSIFGNLAFQDQMKNCYYLAGSATDVNGTVQYGCGSYSTQYIDVNGRSTSLSTEDMKNKASFSGFSFLNIWEMKNTEDYSFPTLLQLEHGGHTFDKQSAEATHLCTNATCTDAATYYYSCSCGISGFDTFSHGTPTGHIAGTVWGFNANSHWHACVTCAAPMNEEIHLWGEGVITVTPNAKEPGEVTYQCTLCQAKHTLMIPTVSDLPTDVAPPTHQSAPSDTVQTYAYRSTVFIAVGTIIGALGFYTYLVIKDLFKQKRSVK